MNEIRAHGWVAGAVVVAAAIGVSIIAWLFAPDVLSDDEPLRPGQTVTIDPGRWVGGPFGKWGPWAMLLVGRDLADIKEWHAVGSDRDPRGRDGVGRIPVVMDG